MIMFDHLFEFLMQLIHFTQTVSILTCIVFLVRFRPDRIFLKLIVGGELKNGLFAIRNNRTVFIESFNVFLIFFRAFCSVTGYFKQHGIPFIYGSHNTNLVTVDSPFMFVVASVFDLPRTLLIRGMFLDFIPFRLIPVNVLSILTIPFKGVFLIWSPIAT